jgi:hypothetical protein
LSGAVVVDLLKPKKAGFSGHLQELGGQQTLPALLASLNTFTQSDYFRLIGITAPGRLRRLNWSS